MTIARWVLGVVLALLCVVGTVGNAGIIVRFIATKRGGSMVPLVAGVVGVGACFAMPLAAIHRVWWLPPLLDPGCALLVVCAVFYRRR